MTLGIMNTACYMLTKPKFGPVLGHYMAMAVIFFGWGPSNGWGHDERWASSVQITHMFSS